MNGFSGTFSFFLEPHPNSHSLYGKYLCKWGWINVKYINNVKMLLFWWAIKVRVLFKEFLSVYMRTQILISLIVQYTVSHTLHSLSLSLFLRESACLSFCPSFSCSLHHPAVQSILHPPHHPLSPPSGPTQRVRPVRLCWRLGAAGGTGNTHTHTLTHDTHTHTRHTHTHTRHTRDTHTHTHTPHTHTHTTHTHTHTHTHIQIHTHTHTQTHTHTHTHTHSHTTHTHTHTHTLTLTHTHHTTHTHTHTIMILTAPVDTHTHTHTHTPSWFSQHQWTYTHTHTRWHTASLFLTLFLSLSLQYLTLDSLCLSWFDFSFITSFVIQSVMKH